MSLPSPIAVGQTRLKAILAVVAAIVVGCRPEAEAYRGGSMKAANLAPEQTAAVYRAALAGAFRLDDPSLSIVVDTMLLPRTAGLEGGTHLDARVLAAMRHDGVMKGVCVIAVRPTREPLRCDAARSGYAVRFSEPFARSADSLQVNMVAEQYATMNGPAAERLRFERVYQLARRAGGWQAVREGRMPKP